MKLNAQSVCEIVNWIKFQNVPTLGRCQENLNGSLFRKQMNLNQTSNEGVKNTAASYHCASKRVFLGARAASRRFLGIYCQVWLSYKLMNSASTLHLVRAERVFPPPSNTKQKNTPAGSGWWGRCERASVQCQEKHILVKIAFDPTSPCSSSCSTFTSAF